MAIEAAGQFTFRDMVHGVYAGSRRIFVEVSIGLGLAALSLYVGFSTDDWNDYWVPAAAGFILLGIWLWPVYGCYKVAKHPFIHDVIHYKLDENGVSFQGPRSEALVKWPGILGWKESKHTLLLYGWDRPIMIPKRFFANPADIESARQLLGSKMPQKK
jgi:hypothetical protein